MIVWLFIFLIWKFLYFFINFFLFSLFLLCFKIEKNKIKNFVVVAHPYPELFLRHRVVLFSS